MEEVPLLAPVERADMAKSLAEAEADAMASRGINFDSATFFDDMMARRAELLRMKAK